MGPGPPRAAPRPRLAAEAVTAAAFLATAVALAVLCPPSALRPAAGGHARRHLRAHGARAVPDRLRLHDPRPSWSSCRCCSCCRPAPCRCWWPPGMLLGGLPEYLRGDRHPQPRARLPSATRGTRSGPRRPGRRRASATPHWATGPSARGARRPVRVDSGVADAARLGRPRDLAEAPAAAARLGHARRRAALAGRPARRDRRADEPSPCCSCSRSPACCSSFARERGARVRPGDRAEPRLPRHHAAAERRARGRRRVHGRHSRSVVALSLAVADELGLEPAAAPQRRVRRAAPRRRQDRRAQGDHQQAGPARPTTSGS